MPRILPAAACLLLLGCALSSAAAPAAETAMAQQVGTLETSEESSRSPGLTG